MNNIVKNRIRDEIGKVEGSFQSLNITVRDIGVEVGNYHDNLYTEFEQIESLLAEAQLKWNNLREKIRPQ